MSGVATDDLTFCHKPIKRENGWVGNSLKPREVHAVAWRLVFGDNKGNAKFFFCKTVTALNEYFATILFAESSLAGTIRRFSIGSSNGVDSSIRA